MKKKSVRQTNQKRTTAPVTLDDINVASLDLDFIKAFVNMLFTIDGNLQLDSLRSGTVSAFSVVAYDKIKGLEKFINSVHAETP